ncbi:alpha/beta-hydrolase [Aureobasidium pullulans EXF-150]|uniref:Alpha/beta-hydrolase n=1 Tax=Aureobasidium pullulans EXF-150 TaxID=1043002 RepID=A0A074YKC9_AURPU|nr:alpha/beta-hydrolase [Aureobasidium pullulans EXF-150]KEQ87366.1 alpha/beta-hydrolase [Aureobasidium pullulans EXF-150]
MDDDRKKPPMEPSLTYTYKQVGNKIINLDVFSPSKRYGARNIPSPVMLFIHGGAWIGGNRQEFSRPVFEEFLSHEFVIVSTDYRLVPESSFVNGQLEDIRDVETWIKTEIPSKLKDHGFDVQTEQIVVVGGSAGALLALLTAGGATKEGINQISPLQLCEKIEYPPVYQYTGAQDGLFETCHVTDFAAALEKQGIPHKEHSVPGVDHAFDMGAKVGDDVHLNVIKPAVDWIVEVVGSF